MMDKEKALYESHIHELEDQLMNVYMERNIAESRNTQMLSNFKMFKRKGLIDDDLDLERGIV